MKKLYTILIITMILLVPSITTAEEKAALKNSYFGNFNNCKIQKKSGNIRLKIQAFTYMATGIQKLDITYDEIWISEYDELFTETEKRKWKGQFDLNTLYWKNNKVQAYTIKKFYTGPSAHKITDIYSRSLILKNIKN